MAESMEKLRRLLGLEGRGQTTAAARTIDFSGMPSRGPMAEMAKRAKSKKREESKMGSDKNIDKERIGKGGFEAPSVKKVSDRSKNRPSTAKDSMDIPVSPMMPTAGIAGLAGGPSGAAAERMPEMGRETYFGPSEETVMPAPRMRRGLFGEEIPEDEYLEMERKNKEAGFYSRFKKGGSVKKKAKNYASGGSVSSASKRADGCCQKGKTKGRMV